MVEEAAEAELDDGSVRASLGTSGAHAESAVSALYDALSTLTLRADNLPSGQSADKGAGQVPSREEGLPAYETGLHGSHHIAEKQKEGLP